MAIPCGPGRVLERRIEVEFEARVECQGIVRDLNHMDLVIPLEVDCAEVILIEKVIGDNKTRVILGEHEVVWASAHTEVDEAFW